MDNPKIRATMGTRQTKIKTTKQNTHHIKLKRFPTQTPPKIGIELRYLQRVAVPFSYKTPIMIFI